MICGRCGDPVDRVVSCYWDRALEMCAVCCAGYTADADERGWPDAPPDPGPPFYLLDENLNLHERAVAPGRAIAVCDVCGDDSTTLIANTGSRCIITPKCKGRRHAGPALEKAPSRKRSSTPRCPKPEVPRAHYPCPQCDVLHGDRTESGMPTLCTACRDYTAAYGRNFIGERSERSERH